MFLITSGKRVVLPTSGPETALIMAQAQSAIDGKGYELMTDDGRVVASVHPKHTEIYAWAKVQLFNKE